MKSWNTRLFLANVRTRSTKVEAHPWRSIHSFTPATRKVQVSNHPVSSIFENVVYIVSRQSEVRSYATSSASYSSRLQQTDEPPTLSPNPPGKLRIETNLSTFARVYKLGGPSPTPGTSPPPSNTGTSSSGKRFVSWVSRLWATVQNSTLRISLFSCASDSYKTPLFVAKSRRATIESLFPPSSTELRLHPVNALGQHFQGRT